jgi:hypothetical protein
MELNSPMAFEPKRHVRPVINPSSDLTSNVRSAPLLSQEPRIKPGFFDIIREIEPEKPSSL